jgi:hypothetical protein
VGGRETGPFAHDEKKKVKKQRQRQRQRKKAVGSR